ncbi:MAG: conjugative transposon protein TraM [Chitinophagaceae bacterium]
MKSEERTQAFLRKRKMLVAMPVLVIPFLTLAFWANGGGRGKDSSSLPGDPAGLNLNLPDAKLKNDDAADKLSFYDQAEKDSLKLAELMQRDPYYQKNDSGKAPLNELERITEMTANKYNQPLNSSPYDGSTNKTEQKIMERLGSLEQEMNRVPPIESNQRSDDSEIHNEAQSNDMDRLENMMQMINQKTAGDPEMAQLDNTLEKILDIQHPDRVKEKIKTLSVENKGQVFAVSRQRPDVPVSLFGKSKVDTSRNLKGLQANGFYGGSNNEDVAVESNAIEAVVHESQTITNGSIVKLRLVNDVFINGSLIPKDNFIFGVATLSGERLEVEITTIRYQNSLFPVKLAVHDLDGLEGIFVPGAISRDVAKQSADNSLQMMELSSINPNIGVQAASAGINAAKNLISKKVKLVKVGVKAGYKVLLWDSKL